MGTVGNRALKCPEEEEKVAQTPVPTTKAILTAPIATEGIPTQTKEALETLPVRTITQDLDIRSTHPKVEGTIVTQTITLAHQPTPATRKNEDIMINTNPLKIYHPKCNSNNFIKLIKEQ